MFPRSLSTQRWLLLGIVIMALAYQFLTTTILRESFAGDEGFYGTVSLNMAQSWDYWLHPTQVPEGTFETERARLGHPCIHCMAMTMAAKLFGGGIMPFQLISLASFVLVLYYIHKILSLWDGRAADYAVFLTAISPFMLSEFRFLQAEPLMAAAGVAGIYFAVLGVLKNKMWLSPLAGGCFGLAFLTKLWLSFPYPFAGGVAVILLSRLQGQTISWLLKYLLLLVLIFVLISALHLLAVWIWTPGDMEFWLRDIYFSLFIGEGVQGTKLHGDSPDLPSNWAQPFWYYFAITYRNHFFLLPIIAVGAPYVPRRVYPALTWIAPGIASIVLLSAFAIKSSLYILSSTLFVYALAGLCLSALLSKTEHLPLPRSLWNIGLGVLMLLLLLGVLLAPPQVSLIYKGLHTVVMLFLLGVLYLATSDHHRRTEVTFLWGSVTLFVLFLGGDLASRYPSDRVLADMIRPYVKDVPPNKVAFVAPNFKSFQLYLFKRGRYWKDTPLNLSPEAFFKEMQQQGIKVFLIGPEEWQNPALTPIIEYMVCHAKEITDQFRQQSGFITDRRVFVFPF